MRLDDSRAVSSTKRWVPPSVVRRNALSHETYKNDIIFRKVRGILNKLTPEKFKKLSDDILKLDLDSRDILKGVILLIFEKALDEPKYSSMYAQLCHRLCEEAPNFESQDSKEPCTFRLLLLGSCRQKFESRPKNERDKRKSLGNIKFIGELCKLGVVSESILHKCMVLLLKKCDVDEQAENLECLCQILKTCGRILDHEKGQKLMNQYFERMESLMENEALPSRIRFMLQDSIELRSNAWVPRKAAKIEGPLPINQIMVDGDGAPVRERPPQQELFPRQLKTRTSGIDAMLSNGTIHFPQSDKFPSLYPSSNGYGGGGRGPALKVSTLLYPQPPNHNPPSYHHNNRYSNNSNNNNSKNNNMKDITPRFKRISHETTTNLEEVSLRPPANSMLVKQFNTKPASQSINNPLFKNSTVPVLTEHKPVPIQSSKDMSLVIKPANTDKTKPSKKDKASTKEETMKKINSIAEDIMNEGNLEEAVSSFTQLKIQDRLVPECIVALITCTYEKTDNDRKHMMNLLMELKNEGSINSTQFSEAFRTIVKTIPDTEASVPNIIDIVAEYAAQGINLELLNINQIGEITENGSYFPLMFSTLRCLHELIGKEKLSKLFFDSKVSLMSCLSEGERRKEKLESVLGNTLLYLCPVLELEGQLWQALEREGSSAQSLYKQAKESLGTSDSPTQPFITALVTVVIKYIFQESVKENDKVAQDKEKSLLERFKGVLQAFLHENINLQVTAVYALQMFAYYLDFPKGMLLRWFVYLYNLEIVEEEAFLKWREDDVTDAYPGKGEALFQVNQWLNWLSTAEEEEDEEEGET